MAFPLVAAMGVADFLKKRQEAKDQRKAAQANILQSQANRLGSVGGGANVQAAGYRDKGPGVLDFAAGITTGTAKATPGNTASMLQSLAEGRQEESNPRFDPLAQDYENNPPTYGGGRQPRIESDSGGGYVGSKLGKGSGSPTGGSNPYDDYAMSEENDALTGYEDEDEALASIGIF
jgi:hypothetical protein